MGKNGYQRIKMPYELMEGEATENPFVSGGKEVSRHLGRTAANITSTAVGLPGDIFSLINDYIAKPITEAITGESGVSYEETYLGKALPTSETHKKRFESAFGENVKPQNELEKFGDDTFETLYLLLNPSKIASQGIKKGVGLGKNFLKSLGANFAGETSKQLTDSEGLGTSVKAGALFVLSLLDKESAAKQVGKLYKESDQYLSPTATTKAASLEKNSNALEKSITKGRPRENLSAPEMFVIKQIDKVKNLISKGEVNVDQTVAQKRSLSQELSSLYKEVPSGKEQAKVRNLAKQLNGYLNQTIAEYGKKNPKYYTKYKEADQAFGVLANSNFIGNWVKDNITHSPITHGLMHLFEPVSGIAGKVAAPYYGYKLYYQMKNSPVLRKIYGNTMKAALKEDANAFGKYFKQLDDAFQTEESKERYEFVD